MMQHSPLALRMLKASLNAADDGLAGHPAARRRRHAALLPQRGGAGGPQRVRREAQAGVRPITRRRPCEPMGRGRAAAHAAGRRRAGARRHGRGGGRRPLRRVAGRVRAGSSRSRCRSAPTTPTTTATACAAPTTCASGRCGSWPRGWRAPAAVKRAAIAVVRGRRRRGSRAGGRGELVARAGRGRVHRRGLALHRRAAAVRLRRARRGVRVRVLRPRRHGRHRVRAGGAAHGGDGAGRRAGRAARHAPCSW